jgi:DNA-binding NarL/FixJ family response regulator
MSLPSAVATWDPTVVIIDGKSLRRAGIVELLKSWACTVQVSLIDYPGISPALQQDGQKCRMTILNLGDISLNTVAGQRLVQDVQGSVAGAPLVLISDREESSEIISAAQFGVSGFIPTSIAPGIAISALTFIMAGGSFFPPGALVDPRFAIKPAATDNEIGGSCLLPGDNRHCPLNIIRPHSPRQAHGSAPHRSGSRRRRESLAKRPNLLRKRRRHAICRTVRTRSRRIPLQSIDRDGLIRIEV